MKIEPAQLPEEVREFFGGMFYMWEQFPPSWLEVECELEEEHLEVTMRFDEKETSLSFTNFRRDSWGLEEGESHVVDLNEFRCENAALFQLLFNMRFKKNGKT